MQRRGKRWGSLALYRVVSGAMITLPLELNQSGLMILPPWVKPKDRA